MTINREHLAPCPFCGGSAENNTHSESCYFTVNEVFQESAANNADLSLAPAVLRAWNTRAQAQAAQEAEPVAEVSQETFSSDGTSDIITCNLPIGTKLYTSPQHDAELVESERANAECFRQIATDLVMKVLILTAPGDELRRASADALERIEAKLATLSAKNEGGKA